MIRRRAPRLAAAAVIVALALSGCTPAPETPWRDLVQQAATQASTGDYATAQATLLTVESDVTSARDEGRIDAARADAILAAAAAVREQLTTLASPAPTSEPQTVTPTAPPAETPVSDTGDAEEEDTDDDSGGNGNSGNNGKGNKEKNDKDDK